MKTFIMFVILFFFDSNASAEDKKGNKNKKEIQKSETSYDARVEKKYIAYFDIPLASNFYGLGLGFQLSPSLSLETVFQHYSLTLLSTEKEPERKYRGYFFSETLHYFFSNSGNLGVGLTNRNASLNNSKSFSSVGLNFSIGNRWQWMSGWMLGIDWISAYQPLYYLHLSEDLPSELTYIESTQILSPLTMIKINLGFSF